MKNELLRVLVATAQFAGFHALLLDFRLCVEAGLAESGGDLLGATVTKDIGKSESVLAASTYYSGSLSWQ